MKTILVDAWDTFIIKDRIFYEMKILLDSFENRKLILTNANGEQMIELGIVDMPYEVFTLKHNPDKVDHKYYEAMLAHFNLTKDDVVYFEHSDEAVKSAKSVGITTYHYDKDTRDLIALGKFLKENL